MAITIHQQPDAHSAISTPLIVTASSTNSSNDGFKYVIRMFFSELDNIGPFEHVVSPNAAAYLVFDCAPSIRPYMRSLVVVEEGSASGIHANNITTELLVSYPESADGLLNIKHQGFLESGVAVYEGWNIDGVFTINEGSQMNASFFAYNFLDFSVRDGYKPSLLAQIGHEDGDQSRIMSDRLPTTYDWAPARFLNLSQPNAIYIPARGSDWGVFTIRQYEDITGAASNARKVRLSILPNSGAPIQQVYNLPVKGQYSHMPFWPANLNASTLADIIKPQDYPNWKAIYFQILNESDEQVSMNYVMFNVEHPQYGECSCHHYEVVRLAWVGRRGGWEYYNFNMLSETEYETDQKTAKKIVGNYGTVSGSEDFTFNSFDESEVVTYKKINKFVTCNTDILQPNEWEFLKGLILSKQVHWVHDDGTHTPVIIQDSNFKVRNPKSKAREALTVRFKVAQDQSN